jgi:hypothetical protein
VILESPASVSTFASITGNLIAIVLGVGALYAVVTYLPVLLMFAIVAGFLRANRRGRRRRRW